MHPYLSYELARQRAADAARGTNPVPADRARPTRPRRSSFVLVRTTASTRVFRRVRPEGGET
jgi:hypothetical protein